MWSVQHDMSKYVETCQNKLCSCKIRTFIIGEMNHFKKWVHFTLIYEWVRSNI